jgi:hypothetical protein
MKAARLTTKQKGKPHETSVNTFGVNGSLNSSDMSSFSNKTTDVTAYEQSWVVPYGVTALATTSTKFGVTAKDIICMCLSQPRLSDH